MNVIGFDDGPFARDHRGRVLLVGVVCSGTRLDGVVSGRVQRDGADSTRRIVELVGQSPFGRHVQAIVLQGIAVGGFNVVDIHGLSQSLGVGVLVVTRRRPDMDAGERALFGDDPSGRPRVRGASRKWRLIRAAGRFHMCHCASTSVGSICATGRASRESRNPVSAGRREKRERSALAEDDDLEWTSPGRATAQATRGSAEDAVKGGPWPTGAAS